MGDRPPDDTNPPAAPRPHSQGKPGAYYYDDQTGYQPYDPATDADEDETPDDDRPATTNQT